MIRIRRRGPVKAPKIASETRRRPIEAPWIRTVRLKYGPEVRLQDISASGVRFRCDQPFRPNTTLVLELIGEAKTVLVPVQVVRSHRVTTGGFAWYEIACRVRQPNAFGDLLT